LTTDPTVKSDAHRSGKVAAKVVVVGGSLSGLMTALALSRSGTPSPVWSGWTKHRRNGGSSRSTPHQLAHALGEDRTRRALSAALPLGATSGSQMVMWHALHAGLWETAELDPLITQRNDSRVTFVGQERIWRGP
jgi:glycine/D-amino acid oxidase-like deaminating enzyme